MLLTLYLYGRLLGHPLLVGEVILPLLDVICLSAKRTRRHLKARELLEPCTYAACMPCMAARKPDRLLIPFYKFFCAYSTFIALLDGAQIGNGLEEPMIVMICRRKVRPIVNRPSLVIVMLPRFGYTFCPRFPVLLTHLLILLSKLSLQLFLSNHPFPMTRYVLVASLDD
jgi:hypothetical protein